MKQIYSESDILRFLYDEMPREESERFVDELVNNQSLWNLFEEIKEIHDSLPEINLEPSDICVASILNKINETPQPVKKANRFSSVLSYGLPGLLTLIGVVSVVFFTNDFKSKSAPEISNYWNITDTHQKIQGLKTRLESNGDQYWVARKIYGNAYLLTENSSGATKMVSGIVNK